MNPVKNVSPSLPGEPLEVYIFVKDPWYDGPVMAKDWIGLLVSLLKVSEIYSMSCGATMLARSAGPVAVVGYISSQYLLFSYSRRYRENMARISITGNWISSLDSY